MITITKDKIYRSPFSLKSTKKDSEYVKEIDASELIYNLGEPVEFGDDVTFSRIFDLIIFHKKIFNIIYSSEMKGLLIDDFISDYEKEVTVFYESQEYKLRLMWVCDVYEYDAEVDFIDYISLDAYGKIDNKIDENNYGISISFSSLSEIRDSIIFIDNSFDIQDLKNYDNDFGSIFKASYRELTLYQIIGAIISEISYYGKPEERDAQKKEIQRKGMEVEKWIEEGTVDEHTKSWNDIESELDLMFEDNLEIDDEITFWDVLYPKSKSNQNNVIDNTIISIYEGSGLSLDEQLQEAHDAEDYEKAAKLKKLIDKRDKNNLE